MYFHPICIIEHGLSEMRDLAKYLVSTEFLDYDHERVVNFVTTHVDKTLSIQEQVISLYLAVRDKIRYNPYVADLSPPALKASSVVSHGEGFCVNKAVLLSAGARYLGIPSRLGFADVQNHLSTERILNVLKSDIFAFHGFSDIYMNEKWVKATPAFSKVICRAFGVAPLEFDCEHDSVFQEYTGKGQKFMQYLHYYGVFDDLPYEMMAESYKKHYPHLNNGNSITFMEGDFESEARSQSSK